MLAAYAKSQSATDPLSGLEVGELSLPPAPQGWVRVRPRAVSLNHHDLWSLRGVGLPAERLPMVLGCDAAGVTDDGSEVVVHSVITSPGWRGDETMDPKRSILSEVHPGSLAEEVWVPAGNVVPKPDELSFEEAACLPTAWLTAYRMLFTRAQLSPGDTVLIQGAGGGVATAAIALAAASGLRVWVTSRDATKLEQARQLGAAAVFESGARLPERVDAVIETVGKATWSHSLKSLRPGGTLVVSGATTGQDPSADLNRVFFLQLSVVGSTMGTSDELRRLLAFVASGAVRPVVAQTFPLAQAREAFEKLEQGDVFGKLVLTV